MLNTIVAESIDELITELESRIDEGAPIRDALRALLSDDVSRHKRIIFNGDGYSEEWVAEAERRGLLNYRSTLDAFPSLMAEKNVALFERYNVLTGRELASRHEIMVEQYFLTVNIEGETAAEMARTMILPAASRYLTELVESMGRAKEAGLPAKGLERTAKALAESLEQLIAALETLAEQNAELGGDSVHAKAEHMRTNIIPAMAAVRRHADELEKMVPDDLWAIPTYRDMLFVK